jgi:hypothetical protein
LKLCTVLLAAEGYRPEKGSLAHFRTLKAMPLILGADREPDADYLDSCRQKRNKVEYDYVGGASREDAEELIGFCAELREQVFAWLRARHPDLEPTEEPG